MKRASISSELSAAAAAAASCLPGTLKALAPYEIYQLGFSFTPVAVVDNHVFSTSDACLYI